MIKMCFNFLPQQRTLELEVLTYEEVNKLIENKEAEHFFYKTKDTMFGIKVFLLYENRVYFLNKINGMSYYERIHGKEYLKILKEVKEER